MVENGWYQFYINFLAYTFNDWSFTYNVELCFFYWKMLDRKMKNNVIPSKWRRIFPINYCGNTCHLFFGFASSFVFVVFLIIIEFTNFLQTKTFFHVHACKRSKLVMNNLTHLGIMKWAYLLIIVWPVLLYNPLWDIQTLERWKYLWIRA